MAFDDRIIYQVSGQDLKDFALEIVAQVREANTRANAHQDEWGSREQAANILGVCLASVHSLMNRGALETRKIGRRTLINLSRLRRDLGSGELGRYKRMR